VTLSVYASNRKDRKRARRVRVWFNGQEVSDRCFCADDKRGIVGLYKVNERGAKYVRSYPDDMRPAVEYLRGKVRMARGPWCRLRTSRSRRTTGRG
jgi:hypothetical protein